MDEAAPLEVETPGGLSVSFRGSWLYSSRDPRALPERSARSFHAPERSLVVVFSPLLGYGLDILLSRLPPGSSLLCLEAEESLYRLSLLRIPEELRRDPRFTLLHAKSPADLMGRLPGIGRFRRALPLSLSGGYRLHASVYDSLLGCLEREIGVLWRNRATLSLLGRLWVRNLLQNLSLLPELRDLCELDRAVGNKAVLVAAAGPSLERLSAWLPPRRGSVFLLAVDTALPTLRALSLEPDAIVCLEGQAHNLKDFIGSRGSRIPLIADLTAHPVSLRCLDGPVYPVSSRFADCALLDRLGAAGLLPPVLPPLGSVGVAALSIAARRWGKTNAILIAGLDFAYVRGKIHSRGSPSHGEYLRHRSRLSQDALYAASLRAGIRSLPAPTGGEMITDPVLSGYAALARAELAESSARAFDLRQFGLDLGIAPLPDGFPLNASAIDEASSPRSCHGERPHWADRGRVADFMGGELARVRELREILAGKRAMDGGRLTALLRECDYLSLHFPDRPRRPEEDRSYLNRLSVEADAAIARWEASLSRVARKGRFDGA